VCAGASPGVGAGVGPDVGAGTGMGRFAVTRGRARGPQASDAKASMTLAGGAAVGGPVGRQLGRREGLERRAAFRPERRPFGKDLCAIRFGKAAKIFKSLSAGPDGAHKNGIAFRLLRKRRPKYSCRPDSMPPRQPDDSALYIHRL
jgi:hypothetical protein